MKNELFFSTYFTWCKALPLFEQPVLQPKLLGNFVETKNLMHHYGIFGHNVRLHPELGRT